MYFYEYCAEYMIKKNQQMMTKQEFMNMLKNQLKNAYDTDPVEFFKMRIPKGYITASIEYLQDAEIIYNIYFTNNRTSTFLCQVSAIDTV